jgi:hypothetical protein
MNVAINPELVRSETEDGTAGRGGAEVREV